MELSLKDALELYQAQVEITNHLWTFFGTVTLAVLGFTIGSEKATRSGREVFIIVAGYVLFAFGGNLPALRIAYDQLGTFSELVKSASKSAGRDSLEMAVYGKDMVSLFHLAVVLSVSAAIVVYWHSRRHDLQTNEDTQS